jgi:rod shape determining protein RodA
MWIAANVPPQMLMRLAVPIYTFGVALLIAVAMFGIIKKGARRWLHVGVDIQPSEILKIAMPLMLAWYFQQRANANSWKSFGVASLLLGVPFALIAKQPDLGTGLMVGASGFYVIFLAGLPWKALIGLAVAGAAALPVAWSMMHDYQRERVMTLIDPTSDPLGKGFHIIQSEIAIGSGGVMGKGYGKGTQSYLEFIPEQTTDFLFSVAGAITMIFFTYAFVNMGMVSGILPVVGVPLPFMSYGGTAFITLGLGAGILMSIQRHRKLVQT